MSQTTSCPKKTSKIVFVRTLSNFHQLISIRLHSFASSIRQRAHGNLIILWY